MTKRRTVLCGALYRYSCRRQLERYLLGPFIKNEASCGLFISYVNAVDAKNIDSTHNSVHNVLIN